MDALSRLTALDGPRPICTPMTDPAPRTALWMLCGALAFATMGALTRALGDRCDWLVIALVRMVFMFFASTLMARAAGVPLVVWKPATLWWRSLAGSFSLVCNFFAMTRLPISEVLTLTNAYPLWIVALSALLLRQPPTVSEALGVASGVIGVVLIQQPMLYGSDVAAGVALVGSVASALAMLGLHRLKGVDPRAIMAHFSGVASLIAGAWLALRWSELAPIRPDPATLLMLLGVGATGTVGQFFLTRAYAAGVPARVSVISLTQVLFGIAFDAAIWGYSMPPLGFVGSGLVLAPAAWLTSQSSRRDDAGAPI
jgi:drug/metabolite transporter (DMT)-like permease